MIIELILPRMFFCGVAFSVRYQESSKYSIKAWEEVIHKMKETFVGEEHRVQLAVHDFTGPSVPQELRKPAMFVVQVLPISAHLSTPFYRGDQVYYGDQFSVAWGVVRAWTDRPNLYMSKRWKNYRQWVDPRKGD